MPQMKFTLIRNHLEALQQIETSAGSASWQVVYHKATLQLPNTLFDLCKPSLLLTLFNELCAFFYLPAECDAPFQFCSACTVGLTLLFQSKEMLLLMRRWKLEFKYQTDECYVKKGCVILQKFDKITWIHFVNYADWLPFIWILIIFYNKLFSLTVKITI